MKVEIDKNVLDDLETRVTTYGLLLSAMVREHGEWNTETGQWEYFVTLPMLQRVSESHLFTTNEIDPATRQPQTKVHIIMKEDYVGDQET